MSRRGFSLGESIVALTIMALVAIFVVQLFLSSMRAVESAGLRQQANQLAGRQLAYYISRDFAQLHPGPLNPVEPLDPNFKITASVEAMPDTPHLCQIRVRVQWRDKGGERVLERTRLKADVHQ